MNLSDQLHSYFTFNLTPLLLRFHDSKSPVRRGNERHPDVDEVEQHLAIATTNIGTPHGFHHGVTDYAPIPTSVLAFSANSRSPPLSNRLLFPA